MYTKPWASNSYVNKSNSFSPLNSSKRPESSLPKSNIPHTLFYLLSQDLDAFSSYPQSANPAEKQLEKGNVSILILTTSTPRLNKRFVYQIIFL